MNPLSNLVDTLLWMYDADRRLTRRVAMLLMAGVWITQDTLAQNTCSPNTCKGPNLIVNGHFENPVTNPSEPIPNFTTEFGVSLCPPSAAQDLWGRLSIQQDPNVCYFNWIGQDHTYGDSLGHMLIVDFPEENPNGSANFMNILSTQVNVTPGVTYCFGAWYRNLNVGVNVSRPNFRYVVNSTLIGVSPLLPVNGNWQYYGFTYTVPAGVTVLELKIQNGKFGGIGNDLAIDDLEFREIGSAGNQPVLTNDQLLALGINGTAVLDVLANDDPNEAGAALVTSSVTLLTHPDPSEGTATVDSLGMVHFTPAPGFTGSVNFVYEACHSWGCCNQANISITVDQVLPTEILDLTAQAGDKGVQLRWMTLRESGNDHFVIERRTGRRYEAAGQVKSQGDTEAVTEYTFLDAEAPTADVVSYRLRQVNRDGSFSYSPAVEVQGVRQALAGFEVWPNPAAQTLHLRWGESRSPVRVALLSLDGRVLHLHTAGADEITTSLDIADIAPGVYLLRLSGDHTAEQRVVIMP
ncbi:MAG: Ig-like domain-containing protein [Bacteroidia bacterium]|nr:Ig-like domain-containing protein [Bacteroidia bacterium]